MELGPLLHDFFIHLRDQRGVSPNTVKSYRDTFKLLIDYLRSRRRPGHRLDARDLEPKAVLAFLLHLEQRRHNSAITRNQRLVAIQSFFSYAALLHPSLDPLARRLRTIKPKRTRTHDAPFLDPKELETLLKQPNPRASDGFRDLTVLAYAYNTGARAQEVADTRISWFDFRNRTVKILGKGRHERTTPLWPSTVHLLTVYQNHHRRRPRPEAKDHFFINQRGGTFTRFGVRSLVKKYLALAAKVCPSLKDKKLSTHSLRHTTANHLADSKVDPTGVKNWLGHARLSSSSRYLNTDLNQKRKILERFGPPRYVQDQAQPQPGESPDKILDWLKGL